MSDWSWRLKKVTAVEDCQKCGQPFYNCSCDSTRHRMTAPNPEPATTESEPVCPKCGAIGTVFSGKPLLWACGSYQRHNERIELVFYQSNKCRIAELERENADLRQRLCDVETNADPAGTVREWRLTQDENKQLREVITDLRQRLEAAEELLPRTSDGAAFGIGSTIFCPKGHGHLIRPHDPMCGRIYCCAGECWSDGCQGDSGSGTHYNANECLSDPTAEPVEKEKSKEAEKLRDVEAERDAALSLLKQFNPNRGLLLNGVAIGWNHDHIAGFVAGIGGSKTIYPTILDAIRFALSQPQPATPNEKGA